MYLPANPFLREHRYTNRVLAILPLLLIMLITGCATLPTDYTRTESTAIDDYQSTSIGQHFATAEAEHEGKSGFAIIRYGRNAYNTRIAMTDLAEKTIDLQVYQPPKPVASKPDLSWK